MAEILISLTIIGVIAAITLPSLVGNINEKTWATQRKALYSRMSQAIGMMDSLNGYGVVFENGSINETTTAQKAAQVFITDGLSKVLKISNVCDKDNLKKCGFPDEINFLYKMDGSTKTTPPKNFTELNNLFTTGASYDNGVVVNYSQLNTDAAAFETANGESILTFYNPGCSYFLGYGYSENDVTSKVLIQPMLCVDFIYDLNGRKGPNKVGKDINFMSVFYPTDSKIVNPLPIHGLIVKTDAEHSEITIGQANAACRTKYGSDVRVANINELESIFVHSRKLGILYVLKSYASSTPVGDNKYYFLGMFAGNLWKNNLLGAQKYFYCIK